MPISKSSNVMATSSITAPLLSQATADLASSQSSTGTGKDSRIHKAAQQFEALMINEMMKTVSEGGEEGWLGSGDETGDDTAMSMAQSQFSQAMAANGGLGLAHMIEKNVGQEESDKNQKPATPTTPAASH